MVFLSALSLQAARRTPLIRFRKGGLNFGGHATSAQSAAVYGTSDNAQPEMRRGPPAIEDWELPHRFRRRNLDQTEIDYINRGGPE